MIYIASLIDYNRVLLEDHGVNCMLESVNVFQETIQLECFQNCPIILILNKLDLLKQQLKLENNGLYDCFNENDIWPYENEQWDINIDNKYWPLIDNEQQFKIYTNIVIEFIESLFNNACYRVNQPKPIISFAVDSTDIDLVGNVFEQVHSIFFSESV